MHQNLQHADHQRRKETDHQHAGADRETDGRRDPDARRRRQAADQALTLEDDTGTQKADAADYLGRNTGGVRLFDPGEVGTVVHGKVGEAVFRYDHRKGRTHADDHMRTDAGFLEVLAAFDADGAAADTGEQQAQAEVHSQLKIKIS